MHDQQQRVAVARGEVAGVEGRRDARERVGEMASRQQAEAERVGGHGTLGAEVERRAENGAIGGNLGVDRLRCQALADLLVRALRDVVEQVRAEHAVEHLLRIDAAVDFRDGVERRQAGGQQVGGAVQCRGWRIVDDDEELVELPELADERSEIVEGRRAARQHAEHIDVEAQPRQRKGAEERDRRRRSDHGAIVPPDRRDPARVGKSHGSAALNASRDRAEQIVRERRVHLVAIDRDIDRLTALWVLERDAEGQ